MHVDKEMPIGNEDQTKDKYIYIYMNMKKLHQALLEDMAFLSKLLNETENTVLKSVPVSSVIENFLQRSKNY